MRLLFDQNLSRFLVGMFSVEYPESRHVTDADSTRRRMKRSGPTRAARFVIVSKDHDFRQLAFLHGPPPRAI